MSYLDELFQNNYHIHTSLSRCGAVEMTVGAITAAAEKAGLRTVALTDHIHPFETPKLGRNIRVLTPQIEAYDGPVKVLLGAELSAHGEKKYTLKYCDIPLEYRLYAHNHYHMRGWEQPEDRSFEGYRRHCEKSMRNVIASGKCDCLAHPFVDHYIVREFEEDEPRFHKGCVTDLWTDEALGDLLEFGKLHGVAFELNTRYFEAYRGFFRRYYHLGKEIGVTFRVGTDAHRLKDIDPAPAKEWFRRNIL
ncbi:MAG: PHP domain-containing protein [Clostridia bacterium]|nr:PHP domain-containing protein [Clostridia bacterium]